MRWSAPLPLLLVALAGCDVSGPDAPPLDVSPEELTLTLASEAEVRASGPTGEAYPRPVQWSSLDPSVASVTLQDGVANVRAVSPGTTKVVARSGPSADTTSVEALEPARFVSVTTGSNHACGLDADGVVYCWGHVLQTGTAEGATPCTPDGLYPQLCQLTPVRVPDAPQFTMIDAGEARTCGLTPAGALYCWNHSAPIQVAEGPFVDLDIGYYEPCVLTRSGAASCWEDLKEAMVQVDQRLQFIDISVDGLHQFCGVTADGVIYCGLREELAPVGGTAGFIAVTQGENHACGLTVDGAAVCWRWWDTSPAVVPGDHVWDQLDAGAGYTCGITTADIGYCWGRNFAHLGIGKRPDLPDWIETPVPILGDLALKGLQAGEGFRPGIPTCAYTRDFHAYCWGTNDSGELGNGQVGPSYYRPVGVWPK